MWVIIVCTDFKGLTALKDMTFSKNVTTQNTLKTSRILPNSLLQDNNGNNLADFNTSI